MVEEGIIVPELETERLRLKCMSEDDLDFVLRHFGDERTNQYSSHGNIRDLDEATDIYERFLKPGQSDRFRLGVILKVTGEIVGTVGLHDYSRRDRRSTCAVWYSFFPSRIPGILFPEAATPLWCTRLNERYRWRVILGSNLCLGMAPMI